MNMTPSAALRTVSFSSPCFLLLGGLRGRTAAIRFMGNRIESQSFGSFWGSVSALHTDRE